MNDPANLALWTQIIVLMSSLDEVETLFQDPNPQQQRAIQNWAHSGGYDYEYSLANRTARVVKPGKTIPVTVAEASSLDLSGFDSFPMPEEVEIDLGGTNADPRIPDVSLLDDSAHWFDRQDQSFWSKSQAPLETEDNCVETSRPQPSMLSLASNSPSLYSPRLEQLHPKFFAGREDSIEAGNTRARKATGPQQSKVTSDLALVYKTAAETRPPEYDNSARDHSLYHNVTPKPDGLYHCPFEDDPKANCTHKPEKLKCNYE